jgi:hypothetical protein
MRKLAGAHHLGFDKEVERRLLTCSDESSSKACVHRSTMSGGSELALSDGSWSFCASKPESLWMGGIGRLVQASGKGMTRHDSGGITHLPQAQL